MQRISVDRIESNFAVCETNDGTMLNIPLNKLPNNVKEGSILIVNNGKITIDKDIEKTRKSKLTDLQNSLFKD